ncbi:MAG: dipeptide/oligopeptide/nickel ABC transporter permease/ATP-binding protein [Actinobacteria bacterium]|nr:dipeptide/oligopeptide/nickel ABC transporter permease/ATP-binding protein [Actinomycetota bacterium]
MSRKHPAARAFFGSPSGLIGTAMAAMLVALAVVGPIVFGDAATRTDLLEAFQSSSSAHPLGTDDLGRDVLARTLAATRLTLELGLAAAAISIVVGFGLGSLVAGLGPRMRGLGRRAIEISMSFPPILLALFLVAIIGTGAKGAVIAVGLGAAPAFARLAENYATSVASKEFVASARAIGVGRTRLVFRYLLPNMAEPLVLAGLACVAGSIIEISGLSFLGLGVQPPSYDWGTLLASGIKSIYTTPWAAIAPAAAITLTGIAVVYLGEALARALNPRLWFTSPPRRAGAADVARPVAVGPEPATKGGALDVRHLDVFAAGESRLVRDVSLSLRPGEALGIVGETGSGKTLTALSLARLVPYPLRAEVSAMSIDGVDLTTLRREDEERVFGTKMAMIFQDPQSSMNPAARIGGQLIDGVRRHRGLRRAAALGEAERRLAEVRIGEPGKALKRYPHQFSGGMQQRIMIAMGLMTRPRVLIADEPTTALDVTVQAEILAVLKSIKEEDGTSIVLISHDLGVVNQICDRIVVMYHGSIVEEGPRERVLSEPRHPYTKGLLASILELAPSGGAAELEAIPGRPPAAGEEIAHCPFAARCPVAVDRCRAEVPQLVEVATEDRVACFLAADRPEVGAAR